MRRQTVLLRTAALCALALQTAACDFLLDLGDDRPGATRLRRRVAHPAWSSDGREIFYTDRAGSRVTDFTIEAVDVASGRARRLGSVIGWNTGGEEVRTTADPSVVFFAITNPDASRQYTIYRVPAAGGDVEPLARNAGSPWFAVSREGSRIAYQGPRDSSDAIQVVTLSASGASPPVAIPTPVSRPSVMGISPDGATVVYGGSGEVQAVDAGGGAHRLLWSVTDLAGTPGPVASPVVWDGATPRLLVASSDTSAGTHTVSLHVVDGATGAHTLVGTIPNVLDNPWTLAQSRDGSAFAAWVPVAVVSENIERTVYRFRLYVQTGRTLGAEPVLDWTADEPLRWLALSPDGRRLGLVLSGDLYVVDIDT